ncbi:hypothetical protein MFIFM68171_02006 [Madurella fahalii]|uniref:Extracellular membrane protein CFEM domain-containing protein n=1 Tax=Madurella fahalii TaxID=1157608 RepID=A0ABQ0G208_9PEZI
MKSFVPFLALAAGVTATFRNAPPFTCPANIDNECTDKQKPGFSFDDLDFGDFFDYNDFKFSGWKCEDEGGGRGRGGRFAPRTGRKVIGGVCHSDKRNSPSFGCGPSIDKFSLGSIHVKPEFDCDLEFHYDMPDGSTCKHRSFCKRSGTTVRNRQCGGARNVTIIYPPQSGKPKPSCSIQVPTVSFDCSTASSTKPPKTTTKPAQSTTSDKVTTTTDKVKTSETSTVPAETKPTTTSTPKATSDTSTAKETSTSTAQESTTSSVAPGSSSSSSIPPKESSTKPAEETSTKPAEETSTKPAEETSTKPAEETTSSSSSSIIIVPPVTKTITTSYQSTSTIFTTSTQTITQCEPTKPDCPGNSVVTTVVTIPVSTTICPVTETRTTVESSTVPVPTGPATTPSVTPSTSVSSGSSGVVTSAKPVETLPCPSVVPSCLNTFMFIVGCLDNTDASCYCPDAAFVKNVYECFYAHGESDAIIAEAVAYFQGICAGFVGQNPGIATDATVTTYITVTATPTVAPVYTTVIVDATTVVPCTDEAGETIPNSSTTVTVSTSMTVPQVGFTTGTTGGVDIIPITAAPIVTGTPGGGNGGGNGGGEVVTTSGTTLTVPTGTGGLFPTTTTGRPIVTAGVGRVGTSFGLAAAVAFAAVAL